MNEAVLDGVVSDPETIARYTANMQREIQHLSRLIDDLFELVQLDSGHPRLMREKTSLSDLISDTISSVGARTSRQGIKLTCEIDPAIDPAYIASDKIQRVLYNLLDNAIHHTPQGGEITLSAHPVKGHLQVSVHNTDSYIVPADLPHIFQSFYRGEPSRAQTNDGYRGTGLGLAIAKGFVEAHGGKLWVDSHSEEGTVFTFTLPF
jgi:signal transduction histidine kinase